MNKRQRLAELRSEAATLTARLVSGEATDEEVQRASTLSQEIAGLVREIEEEDGQSGTDDPEQRARQDAAEAARRMLADLPDDPEPPSSGGGGTPGNRGGGSGGAQTRERTDIRDALSRVARDFTESRSFAQFRANGLSGTAAVDIRDITPSQMALRAQFDSTGVPTRNPYLPGVLEPAYRPLTVLDMVDRQTTNLNSVPYIQETTADPGAGATEVAEAALKPEQTITFAEVDSPVRLIAAWINITRQVAEDSTTVAGYIQGRLGFRVLHRLNGQILSGNGTAPNLRGINNTAGINLYAPGSAEARVISIRKAITMCQQDEYQPDAVVLNPSDWELVELSTDNNGAFRVSPNVLSALPRTIWGLNVVVDTIIASGTATVGAFRLGATWWERSGVRLLMTDSHASNFTSNILTMLAELRGALTVWRPSAFCKITFNGTT